MKPIKAAAVQAAPVFMDLDASITKAEQYINQAAANGAALVAFPETWLPGYPWFVWMGAPVEAIPFVPRYHLNSFSINSEPMRRLQAIAAKASVTVVMGFSEVEGSSRYMSQATIGPDGALLSVRRKLKPTHVERTIFGEGDGSDLVVVDSEFGRLGALNCWEHVQPLVKMAMYAQHEEVHVAAWPSFCLMRDIAHTLGPEVNNAAAMLYAVEGSCFVVAPCAIVSQEMFDMVASTPEKANLLNTRGGKPGGGFTKIYAPDGRSIGNELAEDEEGIVYAELDPTLILIAKAAADPAGHYSRPDAVRLVVDRTRRRVLTELNVQPPGPPPATRRASEPAVGSED
ncbi:carbon-nitrogen hydrolase family protein [Devosia sp. FKR38]|uniref:carbon-nitrogen hydrolase family protein n=1 Tax=Devosia sp. FKR38 TaxID=2562312 RepID=UPI0010C0300A|nr:carbon-nitrogen hydrolase family protein [Devosia sp. FKR38]